VPHRLVLEAVAADPQLLVAHVPHARAIGLTVVEARPNEVWLKVPWSERLVGNPETGVVAGGVITTLLDNAGGSAVLLALEEPRSFATLDLRIDYNHPATPGRDILGYAHCYKLTRSIAFVRGVAYHDSAEDPIATMVATFMLGANRVLPALFGRAP
jgi:uncharacterized protein (TIGR00369 family)